MVRAIAAFADPSKLADPVASPEILRVRAVARASAVSALPVRSPTKSSADTAVRPLMLLGRPMVVTPEE
jgi:hypothetical protein